MFLTRETVLLAWLAVFSFSAWSDMDSIECISIVESDLPRFKLPHGRVVIGLHTQL